MEENQKIVNRLKNEMMDNLNFMTNKLTFEKSVGGTGGIGHCKTIEVTKPTFETTPVTFESDKIPDNPTITEIAQRQVQAYSDSLSPEEREEQRKIQESVIVTTANSIESDKWKEELQSVIIDNTSVGSTGTIYCSFREINRFVSHLLEQQKRDILQNTQKTDISEKHVSSHTNQPIEEKAKIQFRKLWSSITKDNQHLTTEKIEDLIVSIISQTEQECDKKWRERIESKRNKIPKNRHPELGDAGKECECAWCMLDCGKREALDDLLNNK